MESSVARENIRLLHEEREGIWHDASSVRMRERGDCIAAKKELDVCIRLEKSLTYELCLQRLLT